MRKLKLDELGRLETEEYRKLKKIPIVLVLDNIRSALNVGSIFRTADAFRIEKIFLCGITARPPHKEISKTALGATETVKWEYHPDVLSLARTLKKMETRLIGVEQTNASVALYDFIPPNDRPMALLFGNEVEGLNEALLPLLDTSIEIPQYGTKHSLNVAVCAGIVIWQISSFFLK